MRSNIERVERCVGDRDSLIRNRFSTETKASPKTSELAAYIIVFVGILIASVVVNGGDDSSDPDRFTADKAWLYITILTFGYMVARGLAKSGSREPYTDDDH